MTGSTRNQQLRETVLVGVAALALTICGPWLAQGVQAAEDSYRIVVLAFPDLAGDGPRAPACLGCDGRFSTADALRGREDGLAAVRVILRDKDGKEIDRAVSEPLPNGRQSVTLEVETRADYQVEIEAAPEGWLPCPNGDLKLPVKADDFDRSTRTARVQFGFWRGCQEVTAEPGTVEPTEAPAEPAAAESTEAPVESLPTDREPLATGPATMAAPPAGGVPPAVETPAAPPAEQAPTVAPESATVWPGAAGQEVGSIAGFTFLDVNRDGLRAGDEVGVAEVVVRLLSADVTRTVTTTATGRYSFGNLAPGLYDIAVSVPAGYMLTTTTSYAGVSVSNDEVVGVDFGLVPLEVGLAVPAVVSPALPGAGAVLPGSGILLPALALAAGVLAALGAATERRYRHSQTSGRRKDC